LLSATEVLITPPLPQSWQNVIGDWFAISTECAVIQICYQKESNRYMV